MEFLSWLVVVFRIKPSILEPSIFWKKSTHLRKYLAHYSGCSLVLNFEVIAYLYIFNLCL